MADSRGTLLILESNDYVKPCYFAHWPSTTVLSDAQSSCFEVRDDAVVIKKAGVYFVGVQGRIAKTGGQLCVLVNENQRATSKEYGRALSLSTTLTLGTNATVRVLFNNTTQSSTDGFSIPSMRLVLLQSLPDRLASVRKLSRRLRLLTYIMRCWTVFLLHRVQPYFVRDEFACPLSGASTTTKPAHLAHIKNEKI
ncbi:Aste57867_10283 [Aphanomyces stellatus]|uniref:Aste57867_10283 protein n=1 Tax=Aphanomyces stellatus TaxID=120398 RepID=A0A485KQL8_9STRA|nr:hypothetical protein As57867_010243 [Aphanomyces stellatus]VFT87157.1 Aste57867_10283 [Aphanomyces stellatus]